MSRTDAPHNPKINPWWPLSGGFSDPIRLVGILWLGLLGLGCADPCETLAERVCLDLEAHESCADWQKRVESLNRQTCEASLKALKAATQP